MNKIYATLAFVLISSSAQALPLPTQSIKTYDCDRCIGLSHELLQDKWSIANKPLNFIVSNKQKSYGYRQEVTGQQLQNGVPLSFLAPGAVIRVSPINTSFSPALSLQTPNNKTMSLQEASSLYSEDEPLEPSFSKESETIVQIKPELGKGSFILKSLTKELNNNTYMINVLDKFSITHLDVETSSLYYHYGETLKVNISLNDDDNECDVDDIEAFLVDPAGKMTPMNVKEIKTNQFEATYVLNSQVSDNGAHWYVKVNVETKGSSGTIKRNGQTAFSYSIPSASLVQIKKAPSQPLTFTATVEVATASRYSLQAILFKKSNDSFNALETAQTGTWLEPGVHSIEFTFDNSQQLADDSLYLGYLRLVDYGQLKIIYHYDKPIKLSQLME